MAWVLRRLPPEDVPQLSVAALEAGCWSSSTVAVLASLSRPTRADIEDELPALLTQVRRKLPSELEALKVLVDDCARRIVDGEVDPIKGAWAMWNYWANENESSEFFDQVRLFIGLASESDVPGAPLDTYRTQIVDEATRFLRDGGLQLQTLNP